MTIKSTLGSAFLTAALFATAPVFAAAADPSIHQVYEAAASGHYEDAQAMMDKVLRDHPNSATAHYVEADLLAKQGHMSQAQGELSTAERIDPSLKFAKPQALQELRSVIAGGQHVATRQVYAQPQPVYQQPITRHSSDGGSGGGMTIIIVIAMVILFFFIVRMFSRRNTVVQGGYPAGYGPGGVQQGYGPGYGPGMGQGGIGSGILGGLATGAAVGAGIVAGEELMHHFTDRERTETVYDTPQNNNYTQQDDMGGNDFGVSDNSSWDSGGGGGGSDDWN
jgi:hypothetical protein